MKSQKLTLIEKIGYGSGDAAVNVVISAMFLIVSIFYTDVFGLDPKHMGLMFLLVRFLDAVTDPLMGTITDKFTTRFGRYRHYFLWLAVPFGISVFLTFSTPDFSYNAKLVWAYSTYIFVTLMFTAVTIPYISIISVLTEDPQERLSANGYRLFFAKVAAFAVSIVVPLLADVWGKGDLSRGYQMAMGVMAVVGTLLFFFCFATTTERVEYEVDRKPFFQQLSLLLRNDQWLLLCAVCIVGTTGYVLRGSVAAYYAKYFLGGDAKMISTFLGTGVAAAILAMIASTWITKFYCKIKMFRWTQLAVGVLSVLMYFTVKPGDVGLALVLYFLICFVVDLHAPVFWSAIGEAVDYGHAKTGQRVAGLAFGFVSFCQKFGMGIAGFGVGWLLSYYGFVANEVQGEHTLNGIALMLCVFPGFFHALMGGIMFLFRITDKYYDGIKAGTIPGLNPIPELQHKQPSAGTTESL